MINHSREAPVTRGKYKGCTSMWVDGAATRRLSEREIEEFKAGIERRFAASEGTAYCDVCGKATNAGCRNIRIHNVAGL